MFYVPFSLPRSPFPMLPIFGWRKGSVLFLDTVGRRYVPSFGNQRVILIDLSGVPCVARQGVLSSDAATASENTIFLALGGTVTDLVSRSKL